MSMLEDEIKGIIIESLELEMSIEEIATEEQLFGNDGLGLDSIDALELGLALKRRYKVQFSENKEDNKSFFYSVATLAEYIRSQTNGEAIH